MTDSAQINKVLNEFEKGWKEFQKLFHYYKLNEITENAFLIGTSLLLMNKTHLATDTSEDELDLVEYLPPSLEIEINNMLNDGGV